ncbi:MAG: hypothetical protein JWM16_6357 [Verrucomicrobiales bacterium]|nr:hypothetical protein [Verrucomicrobiales bacterium]
MIVTLPDGRNVKFPDDMPKEEIRALIEHKFPDAVASKLKNAAPATSAYKPIDIGAQGLDVPGSSPDPAHTVQPGEEHVGFLAPVTHNTRTGQWSPSVPGVLTGIRDSVVDAVKLPGDVAAGKYPEMDPRVSKSELSPDLIGRGLNAATAIGTGDAPAALGKVPGSNALTAPGAKSAGDFGIPLTRGQAAGDLQQITKEEMLRNGGGSAQNVMRNFDATQRDAIGGVADTIGAGLGSNAESMPDLVTTAIRDKVAFHKDQAASLYEIAADGGVSIKPEMVDALPQVIAHSLETGAITVDQQLTPGATAAMKLISEDTAKMTSALADAAAKPDAVKGSGGITLQGVEQIRKKLVNLGEGANATDARAIRAIKKSFDDWAQTAVDNMLVTGDESALQALKKARAASADYLSITNPHEGDAAGAAVAKMQKGDATAEEVANWLYGADVVSPTLNAPKVASRVKGLVGADSAEWKAVRAAAWDRLTKDMASGDTRSNTMLAKRIETFLNAKGSSLSKVLYSDDERAQMQKFADALKSTITPRDATNPSRTAFTLTAAMNGITRLLTGTAIGSVAGPWAGVGAAMGVPVFKSIGARRAAIRATTQGPEKVPAALTPMGRALPSNALRSGASGTMGQKVDKLQSVPMSNVLGIAAGAGSNRLAA